MNKSIRLKMVAQAKSMIRPLRGPLMELKFLVSRLTPWKFFARLLGRQAPPTGSITLANYFVAPATRDTWTEIYPSEVISYEPLPDLGQSLPSFLQYPPDEIVPAAGVAELYDCRYWGYYGGTVVNQREQVIEEFSREVWDMRHNRIFHGPGLPPPKLLRGTTAVLTCRGADSNYYHWTIDLLPRLHLLEKVLGSLRQVDHFLINHRSKNFQLETLEEVGVPLDKVIVPNDSTHVRLERAFIPTVKEPLGPIGRWPIRFLRSLDSKGNGQGEKIYLSRKPGVGRELVNEADVSNLLDSKGFVTVYAEDFSVIQQRAMFRTAEQIVAVHGAGLANIAWCSPHTKLIEIMSPSLLDLGFRRLAMTSSLSHRVVLGSGPVATFRSKDPSHFANIHVDVVTLEKSVQ